METFGNYIRTIRKNRGITMKGLANHLGVSTAYVCDIEHDRRGAFSADKLKLLIDFFGLSPKETANLYDLAAATHRREHLMVPQDVAEYIMSHEYIVDALRIAKKLNADEKDWKQFISNLRVEKEKV